MEPYSVDNRRNPKVIDLFNRIKIVGDSQLDKLCPEKKPCIVTVKKKDGKRFSQRNDGPFKGDPENPLSAEDLERKFKKMTIPILGKRKAGEILRVIKQLERLNEISQLVDLLV
jgi:2-methylcitrate dehydratase PrpD